MKKQKRKVKLNKKKERIFSRMQQWHTPYKQSQLLWSVIYKFSHLLKSNYSYSIFIAVDNNVFVMSIASELPEFTSHFYSHFISFPLLFPLPVWVPFALNDFQMNEVNSIPFILLQM